MGQRVSLGLNCSVLYNYPLQSVLSFLAIVWRSMMRNDGLLGMAQQKKVVKLCSQVICVSNRNNLFCSFKLAQKCALFRTTQGIWVCSWIQFIYQVKTKILSFFFFPPSTMLWLKLEFSIIFNLENWRCLHNFNFFHSVHWDSTENPLYPSFCVHYTKVNCTASPATRYSTELGSCAHYLLQLAAAVT